MIKVRNGSRFKMSHKHCNIFGDKLCGSMTFGNETWTIISKLLSLVCFVRRFNSFLFSEIELICDMFS